MLLIFSCEDKTDPPDPTGIIGYQLEIDGEYMLYNITKAEVLYSDVSGAIESINWSNFLTRNSGNDDYVRIIINVDEVPIGIHKVSSYLNTNGSSGAYGVQNVDAVTVNENQVTSIIFDNYFENLKPSPHFNDDFGSNNYFEAGRGNPVVTNGEMTIPLDDEYHLSSYTHPKAIGKRFRIDVDITVSGSNNSQGYGGISISDDTNNRYFLIALWKTSSDDDQRLILYEFENDEWVVKNTDYDLENDNYTVSFYKSNTGVMQLRLNGEYNFIKVADLHNFSPNRFSLRGRGQSGITKIAFDNFKLFGSDIITASKLSNWDYHSVEYSHNNELIEIPFK